MPTDVRNGYKYKKLNSFKVLYGREIQAVASPYLVQNTGLDYIQLVIHRAVPMPIGSKVDTSYWVVSEFSTGLFIYSALGGWTHHIRCRDGLVPIAIKEVDHNYGRETILEMIADREILNDFNSIRSGWKTASASRRLTLKPRRYKPTSAIGTR